MLTCTDFTPVAACGAVPVSAAVPQIVFALQPDAHAVSPVNTVPELEIRLPATGRVNVTVGAARSVRPGAVAWLLATLRPIALTARTSYMQIFVWPHTCVNAVVVPTPVDVHAEKP